MNNQISILIYNPQDHNSSTPVPMDISPTSSVQSSFPFGQLQYPPYPQLTQSSKFVPPFNLTRPLSLLTKLDVEEVTGLRTSVTDNVQSSTSEQDLVHMIHQEPYPKEDRLGYKI
jgi:hypothetical protein